MRINNISALKINQQNFNGLWGKTTYSHTKNLYGGEFECDYYEKNYHPCSDETKEQIMNALQKKQKELEEENAKGSQGASGYYIRAVESNPLNITKAQLEKLKNNSEKILNGDLPNKKDFNLLD